jgi:hypothetical protein
LPNTADPEDRKQVGCADKLLREYPLWQIKYAVILARRHKSCPNLFNVKWNSPSGVMWTTLAAQKILDVPRKDEGAKMAVYLKDMQAIGLLEGTHDRETGGTGRVHRGPEAVRFERGRKPVSRESDEGWS